MDQVPKKVSDLLEGLYSGLPGVLGSDLVGVYLYGSLTQDAFSAERSDVDCIIVTRDELSEGQFEDLDAWFARLSETNEWCARLQVTMLVRDKLLTMDAPGCLYQFGKLTRSGSDGNPLIWMNILESGITLYGQPPNTFVPEISQRVVHEALVREVNYIREEFENAASEWRDRPKYRAYAVLTLCRILYTNANGGIASKPVAADWAIRELPDRFHTVTRQAINAETDDDIGEIPRETVMDLVGHVEGELGR